MVVAAALQDSGERRGQHRGALGRTGVLRLLDTSVAPATEVVIADLTRDGCRIETEATLRSGVAVEIGIPNVGRVTGRLVWHSKRGYGCAFSKRLPSGAVTAAFGPSNVVPFQVDPTDESPLPLESRKLSPRNRLLLAVGLNIAIWFFVVVAGMWLLT
jgi:hypothetical protein